MFNEAGAGAGTMRFGSYRGLPNMLRGSKEPRVEGGEELGEEAVDKLEEEVSLSKPDNTFFMLFFICNCKEANSISAST